MPDTEIEVRSLKLEHAQLRVMRSEGKAPRVVGYAAVFNSLSENLGGFREKIDPKAFDGVMEKCDCRALINHNSDLLMGRTSSGTLSLSADETGLKMDFEPPDSDMARHYLAAIDRRDMTGASFSFTIERPDGDDWDEDEDGRVIRTVKIVRDLFDVGPVTYPAYLDTTVASRSLSMRSRRVDPQQIYRQRVSLLRLCLPFLKGSTHA